MKFTRDDIKFGKRIDAGANRTAYLEPTNPNDVTGWWHLPAGRDRTSGPIGAYMGVGSYLAVTTTKKTPGLGDGSGVLAVFLQRGAPTHLVAIASPEDYPTRNLARGGSTFAHYRWVRVLAMRTPAQPSLADLISSSGIVLGQPLPFDQQGGAYIDFANVGQIAGHVTNVQAQLWNHFGFAASPAIFADVNDPGDLMAAAPPEP